MRDLPKDEGVIYVAFGAAHLAMALVSVASLQATTGPVSVKILTDIEGHKICAPFWDQNIHQLIVVSKEFRDSHGNRAGFAMKSRVIEYSPWKRTVFLDSDTLVTTNLSPLFEMLKYFDVIGTPAKEPGAESEVKIHSANLPYCYLTHYNTGVFGFSANADVNDFFFDWQKTYAILGRKNDEPGFLSALLRFKGRFLAIDRSWNSGDQWYKGQELRNLKIWHYKSRPEKKLEKMIIEASKWITGPEEFLGDVKTFINSRRKPKSLTLKGKIIWVVRRITVCIRGGQFDQFIKKVSSARWRDLTGVYFNS